MKKLVSGYVKALRLFQRDIRLLIACTVTVWLSLGIYSVLFNLFLVRLGYDAPFVGLARAVGSLCFAGFGLVAGLLGRRFGSRNAAIAGVGGLTLAYGLMGLAELVPVHWRSPWLLVSNALGWICVGSFFVNQGPFMMLHTTEEERKHAFSVSGMMTPLMLFGGALLGGLLPGLFGGALGLPEDASAPYGLALGACAVFTAAGMTLLWRTGKTQVAEAHQDGRRAVAMPLAIIGFLALFSFFRVTGEHALYTFLNVYFDLELGISTAHIGVLFALGQFLAVPGAIAYPSLAERWGDFRTIAFGVVGISLALLPLILVPHWAPAVLSFAGVMAGAAVVNTAVFVYSLSVVPERWRSVISGATGMANGLGIAAISMSGGIMVGTWGYRSFFGVSAAMTLLGALVFWGYFRVPRGEFAREVVEQPGVPLLAAEGSAD